MKARQQFSQAECFQQQGDWQQAIAAYQLCLQDMQIAVAARCNLATILLKQGDCTQAIEHLTWLRQHQPEQLLWLELLADAYHDAGEVAQALQLMLTALPKQSAPSRWLDRIARYYQHEQQFSQAVAFQRWAIQVNQNSEWLLWFNLANHYLRWFHVDAQAHLLLSAEQAINTALDITVNDDMRVLKAEIEGKFERWQLAINWLMPISSKNARILNRIGVAYSELSQWSIAVDYLQQAINLDASYAPAKYHLANALSAVENYEEANRYYRQLYLHAPNWADVHLNLGLNLLACNHWVDGWREYEWRWQVPFYQRDLLRTSLPLCQPLKSMTKPKNRVAPILIWSEQGIGDTIMWLPWVLYLQQIKIPFAIMLPDRLIPLVQRQYPDWILLPRRAQLNDEDTAVFSAQLPMGSLPFLCQQLDADVALPQKATAYLLADANRVAALKQVYGASPRIGIAWSGGQGKQKLLRSIELSLWQVLLNIQDAQWFCLQHGVYEKDLDTIDQQTQQRLWCDFSIDPLVNLDDFAAQISAMDLVITVDNSTAHLAGALGVETWLLLPQVPEWRWPRCLPAVDNGLTQSSQWYQSVILFYKQQGSWQDLLGLVRERLSAWLANRQSC